jgi:hypothetical protein
MVALVSWLLGNGGAPSHALVWASDGLGIAVAATVLLLAALAVLVAERERPVQIMPRRVQPKNPSINTKNDERLPRAA